jgi:hypothetical protein
MPLVYLLLLVLMMFIGGALITANPAPLNFVLPWGGRHFLVSASILEIIGSSACAGAVLTAVLSLRSWLAVVRERRRAELAAERLRADNGALRRDAENARSDVKLLEARLAEAAERYAALEAEARPLLTLKTAEPASQPDPQEAPPPAARRPAAPSRWRRR